MTLEATPETIRDAFDDFDFAHPVPESFANQLYSLGCGSGYFWSNREEVRPVIDGRTQRYPFLMVQRTEDLILLQLRVSFSTDAEEIGWWCSRAEYENIVLPHLTDTFGMVAVDRD